MLAIICGLLGITAGLAKQTLLSDSESRRESAATGEARAFLSRALEGNEREVADERRQVKLARRHIEQIVFMTKKNRTFDRCSGRAAESVRC